MFRLQDDRGEELAAGCPLASINRPSHKRVEALVDRQG